VVAPQTQSAIDHGHCNCRAHEGIASEKQSRYIRPMAALTLIVASFLALSGLLLARPLLRSAR
jgi:hypothetical protein